MQRACANCQVLPVPHCQILPHCNTNGMIFETKSYWTELRILIFSTVSVWTVAHPWKSWARYDQKRISVFMYRTPLFLSGINDTWNLSTDFLKILRYQIELKSAQWEVSCSAQMDSRTDGQTDTRDAASSRFSQVSNCAQNTLKFTLTEQSFTKAEYCFCKGFFLRTSK